MSRPPLSEFSGSAPEHENHAVFMQTGILKREEVCIKTRSTSTSRSLKGWDTKLTTVKWSIVT